MLIKNCSKCGNKFECKNEPSCWCFKEPKLKKNEIEMDDCVCKHCMQSQYRQKLLGV